LRWRLYRLYDRDVSIGETLHRLHREWWTDLGPGLRRLDGCLPDLDDPVQLLSEQIDEALAYGYLAELRAFATEVGLDRIPMLGAPLFERLGYLPSGLAQVSRYLWHLDKALLWEAGDGRFARASGSPGVERPTFESLASFGTPIPGVHTRIATTDARWDPRAELLVDARCRLGRETSLASAAIEAEIARIIGEGSYRLPDTSRRLERDVEWIWWRLRHRWTYERIVREWEAIHPGDWRPQYRLDDEEARQWAMDHPGERAGLEIMTDGVRMVRKAVTTFAHRAQLDVRTGPGRRTTSI
jgi:hypothetical protein